MPSIDLFKVSDAVFARAESVDYAGLSKQEKVFVCIWALEGEVNNGGFDQYYFNSSGDWALDTPDALRQIGAENAAQIVVEANAVFEPDGPDPERKKRWKQLDALSEEQADVLEALDGRVFACPDDLETLLKRYVSEHRSVFVEE